MLNKESNIWFNQMCLSNSVHQTQPPGVSFFFVTFCLQELLVLNYFLALSLKSPNNSSLPWQKHNILSLIHFSFFCLTILSNCVKLPSLQLTTSCPSKVFKKLWMKWQNILFFHASCNPNPAGQHIIVHAVQDCYWTLLICIFFLFCFCFFYDVTALWLRLENYNLIKVTGPWFSFSPSLETSPHYLLCSYHNYLCQGYFLLITQGITHGSWWWYLWLRIPDIESGLTEVKGHLGFLQRYAPYCVLIHILVNTRCFGAPVQTADVVFLGRLSRKTICVLHCTSSRCCFALKHC